MSRFRNIAFCAVVAAVLFVALGNIAAAKALPGYDPPTRSYLEGRNYQTFPEANGENLASGQLQDQFEQFISDSVPKRHRVMIVNAALQRRAIALAAQPLGYGVYPTFYGSGYAYSPSDAAVCMIPVKQAYDPSDYDGIANLLNTAADTHPGIRFRMALVDRASSSVAAPAHDLISNPVDYPYLENVFLSKLSAAIPWVDLHNTDTDTYYELYFRSDHHWQATGAADAYRKIIASYGKEPITLEYALPAFKGPFYGSYDRSGICLASSDAVEDVIYNASSLSVWVNGEEKPASYLGCFFADDPSSYRKANQLSNVYAEYFHGDPALMEIENGDVQTDDVLCIVGDSFTNNCERFYAEHYRTVYVIDPRKYDGTLKGFLSEHEVDDLLFLLSSATLTSPPFTSFLA